ncbi:MAG TPA: glycosyl hydrolase family 17 protein [Acidimicrobiia bacterium]|jgi:exo-beta-1,3-glucanase (GH17 family)
MSNLYQRTLSLAGLDVSALSVEDLRAIVREILTAKIHGVCFSPYVEGQGPGTEVGEAQIRERLSIVRPHVDWVRSFSTTEGNELIASVATEYGMQTMVGAWIGTDLAKNEAELDNAIEIAAAGHAGIVAVGNEVLLRGDLSEDQLVEYIERVKAAVPGVDVGYVDAYFKFVDHPRVTALCDVILANCYPFWEGCPAEHALLYMKEMYRTAARAANGKKVIISETGWPNMGTPEEGAVPSLESAMKYFIDAYRWAEQDGIEIFYFSAFDETWKIDAEGDVGAYWGLWDRDGNPKYV